MACSVLLLGLLISVVGIHLVQSNTRMVNLAYRKHVYLSSISNPPHRGAKAVNGIFSDFTQTGMEDNPWLRIDLGTQCSVRNVAVFQRSDGCAYRLRDLHVAVGIHRDQMTSCGSYMGFVPRNVEQIEIWCPPSTVGRYVEVQIVRGRNNVFSPSEVQVWGNSSCIQRNGRSELV